MATKDCRAVLFRYFFYPSDIYELDLFLKGKGTVPDSMFDYLEANKWEFGSGYVKEHISDYITKNPLTDDQKSRLYNVALQYLEQRIGREFWHMCRAIARIGDDGFWQTVKDRTLSENPQVRNRAIALFEYSKGAWIGGRYHKKLMQQVRFSR